MHVRRSRRTRPRTAPAAAQFQGPLPRRPAGRLRFTEVFDGASERVAFNETHGVKGPAVRVPPQPVDRHDARMFRRPGDFRLD